MRFIGLMSGSSVDAVDAVCLQVNKPGRCTILGGFSVSIDEHLRQNLLGLLQARDDEISTMLQCERQMTAYYIEAVLGLLAKLRLDARDIVAVGCHGQTIRHALLQQQRYSLQLVDGARLALATGIDTVTDFRRGDIALGGEGAPLLPLFHQHLFATDHDQAVINLGGIANITLIFGGQSQALCGFDTGPANALMDAWVQRHWQQPYDDKGKLAAGGQCHDPLLHACLADVFFAQSGPASTGRDYFDLAWLQQCFPALDSLCKQDVLATLVQLVVKPLVKRLQQQMPRCSRVIVAGGGSKNAALMQQLQRHLAPIEVTTTQRFGFDPQWIEAGGFAWLAAQYIAGAPGNSPTVTGAKRPICLGALYRSG